MKTAALVLASLSFLSPSVFAEKVVPDNAAEHYEGAMRFSTFKPCSGTSALCASQILAEGMIELETSAKLDAFLKTKTAPTSPNPPADTLPPSPKISFDSAGGSMTGALQLGRYLRAHKLNTNLESDYTRISAERADRSETFLAHARCNAACLFAFAGGVQRSVDVESKMGMQHIPRIPVRNVVGGPINPPASELAIYLRDMGVRPELLNVAALAAPGSMVWFSESQLAQTRMDNTQPYASPWMLTDSGTGLPVATVRQEISNGRNVSLMLGYHEGKLVMITSTELSRSLVEDARIQLFPVGGKPEISLLTEKRAIPVAPTRTWARNDADATATFVAVGTISEDDAQLLSTAQKLRLDDALPPGLVDMSSTIDLSTENLQPTLALLLRSK